MEAKDTKWCPQHGYPLPCDKCGLGQYELGFKAGIKEVVEWLENESHFGIPKTLTEQSQKDWQAKQKEWGL